MVSKHLPLIREKLQSTFDSHRVVVESTIEYHKDCIRERKAQEENFSTILSYLDTQFSTFDQLPFCEIDALILAQLSYLNLENMVPSLGDDANWRELPTLYRREFFEEMTGNTLNDFMNLELLKRVCASPRYRQVSVCFYQNKWDKVAEEQFSGVTFLLPQGELVVAFRGTDLTVTGWKEDFNMFFMSPVPSQASAVVYLEEVAKKTTGDMYVVGHSKGGNLAVYSAAFSEPTIHTRILSVYNLDGPGFPTQVLEHEAYQNMYHKVVKIVPEGSLIGVMLESASPSQIIKSYNLSVLQHDPFSWICDGNEFEKSGKFNRHITHLDRTLNQWIESLDVEQRQVLVDTLFAVIESLNVESMDGFASVVMSEHNEIWKVLKELDTETAQCMKEVMKKLIQISFDMG